MLANGAVGKGHGSRALLHALKTSFVMHDSSYSCPMQLTGSKASLSQLLNQIRCESCCARFASTTIVIVKTIQDLYNSSHVCATCFLTFASRKKSHEK